MLRCLPYEILIIATLKKGQDSHQIWVLLKIVILHPSFSHLYNGKTKITFYKSQTCKLEMQKIISDIYESESESEVAQSCPTLCDPIDCSLPGSSVHGILQAIVLEWIVISFARGSSQPRARTRVSRIVNRHVTVWATREMYYLKFGNCFYRYCYFLYNCSQTLLLLMSTTTFLHWRTNSW